MSKWIGVDFDGTLAHYDRWQGTSLGEPIEPMVNRVKKWLAEGTEVRILTARVSSRNQVMRLENGEDMWEAEAHRAAIEAWCERHIGQKLKVTAEKDFEMKELWDDRAVTVEYNTGRCLTVHH
jgi:hypothetical protein